MLRNSHASAGKKFRIQGAPKRTGGSPCLWLLRYLGVSSCAWYKISLHRGSSENPHTAHRSHFYRFLVIYSLGYGSLLRETNVPLKSHGYVTTYLQSLNNPLTMLSTQEDDFLRNWSVLRSTYHMTYTPDILHSSDTQKKQENMEQFNSC
jgi:hypothetical protein